MVAWLLLASCAKLECPAYSGLTAVGTAWDWQSTEEWSEANDGTTGRWTATLDAIEPTEDGEALIVDVSGEGVHETPDTATTEYTTALRFQCDAMGLWAISQSWSGDIATPVGTFPITLEKDLTTYDHLLTPDVAAGSTWTSEPVGTTNDPENGEQPYAETIVRTASAAGGTVVPAGTFDALAIVSEGDVSGTLHSTVDAEIGDLLNDLGELVEYRPAAD